MKRRDVGNEVALLCARCRLWAVGAFYWGLVHMARGLTRLWCCITSYMFKWEYNTRVRLGLSVEAMREEFHGLTGRWLP